VNEAYEQAMRYGRLVRDLERHGNALNAYRIKTAWYSYVEQFRGHAFMSLCVVYLEAYSNGY
jgi:hypothetical protein